MFPKRNSELKTDIRRCCLYSEGAMVWPEGTCPAPDLLWVRYEGQWEEGKIAGYGKMR